MAAHAVTIGDVLDDRFELESVLGRGGFGVVYRARQVSTGQPVAIKILQRDKLTEEGENLPAEVARFQREMELIAQLKHPNIVRLIDSGRLSDGQVFIVLEYIDGETLADLIDREGGLHPRDAGRIMTQVLEALSCAHDQGIVHRDLKPQNIMVTTVGARRSALVLDFGIAAVIEGSRGKDYRTLTATGQFHGTPCYMAPEQLREKRLTPQTDIYAWGLVFLECLTGYPAVIAESFAEIIYLQMAPDPVPIPQPVLDHPLGAIIGRALAKSLQRRYPDADSVLADLDACRGDVAFKLPLYTTAETPDLDAMLATTGAVIPDYDLADTGQSNDNPGSGPSPAVNLETGEHEDEDEHEDGDSAVDIAPLDPPARARTPWIIAGALAVLLVVAVGWNFVFSGGTNDQQPIPGEDLATRQLDQPADTQLDSGKNETNASKKLPTQTPSRLPTKSKAVSALPNEAASAPQGSPGADDRQSNDRQSNDQQTDDLQADDQQVDDQQIADGTVPPGALTEVVPPQRQRAVDNQRADDGPALPQGAKEPDQAVQQGTVRQPDQGARFDNVKRKEEDNVETQTLPAADNADLLGQAARRAQQSAEGQDRPVATSDKSTQSQGAEPDSNADTNQTRHVSKKKRTDSANDTQQALRSGD